VLLDRLGVELGQRLVLDRLVQQRLAADAGLDDLAGNLALAEAGYPHLAGEPPGGAVDRRAELLGLHDDVDPHLGGVDGLDGAAHGCLRWNGSNRAGARKGGWSGEPVPTWPPARAGHARALVGAGQYTCRSAGGPGRPSHAPAGRGEPSS
jgi:hypothetical protein